ncbi:MAG: hypothetical protein KBE79_02240 [Sulfurospirillum sp.]|jgi:hypothetical protein|nr:hypothetical protein [Sulfurospirillum sp.]MBP9492014.1 hypothetical protein [Sulfurospirillum sp.]MBP9612359.1 hypothetical protein [Sulfurospirillum sp.]
MLTFRVDKENNILFINIIGMTPKDKLAEYINEFSQKCSEFKKEFIIVNDMSLCKISSEYDVEVMCKLSQMMLQKFSISKVIRITGANTENLKKLMRTDKKIGLQNIHYASTRKEAEALWSKVSE